MNEFRDNAGRDDSLAQALLPLILIGTVIPALILLMLVLMVGKIAGSAWIYPTALLVAAQSANKARQRGWSQLAGWLLGGAFGFLPVLTVPLFGLNGNPLVYLAAVGVMIAALTVSAKAAVSLACGIFALLVAEVLVVGAGIGVAAGVVGVMLVLLIGITTIRSAGRWTPARSRTDARSYCGPPRSIFRQRSTSASDSTPSCKR